MIKIADSIKHCSGLISCHRLPLDDLFTKIDEVSQGWDDVEVEAYFRGGGMDDFRFTEFKGIYVTGHRPKTAEELAEEALQRKQEAAQRREEKRRRKAALESTVERLTLQGEAIAAQLATLEAEEQADG